MAGKPVINWPDKPTLEKLLDEAGSTAAVAARFGCSRGGLQAHLVKEGIVLPRPAWLRDVNAAPLEGEADSEVSELERLRSEVMEFRRRQTRERKIDILESRILGQFEDALAVTRPKYRASPVVKKTELDEHEHVLLFSDAHASEVVSEEETMGLNSYNWQVMLERMGRIQEAVLSFQENRPYPIRKLHVWMLGDNLSGDIHEELQITNDRPAAEAVVQFGLDMSEWLKAFTDHYAEIHVAGITGNHPRRTKKPTAKRRHNNDDWLTYKFIEIALRDHPQFSFAFPQAPHQAVMVAEKWRCLLLHGDGGGRSTMVDVPWGGIIRYVGKLSRQYASSGQPLSYFAMGHWHQANAIGAGGPGSKAFINGSLKGVDEYGLMKFGGGDPPQQLLLTFHPKRGLTEVQYLDCLDAPSPRKTKLRVAA